MIASLKRKRAEQPLPPRPALITDLNAPLLYLSPHDTFTIGDACEGVSMSSGGHRARGQDPAGLRASQVLRSGMGGLVLCAKADEPQLWMHYAELTGRLDDLVMIAPVSDGGRFTFNILDHEMHRGTAGGGNAANVVETLSVLAEIADAGSGAVGGKGGIGGGENGGFWESLRRTMARHAVTILAASEGRIRLPDIRRLILIMPTARMLSRTGNWSPSASPPSSASSCRSPTTSASIWRWRSSTS
ncbi:MAG: hypothetical protein R3B46_01910 [Phycisphaerales bacterium]